MSLRVARLGRIGVLVLAQSALSCSSPPTTVTPGAPFVTPTPPPSPSPSPTPPAPNTLVTGVTFSSGDTRLEAARFTVGRSGPVEVSAHCPNEVRGPTQLIQVDLLNDGSLSKVMTQRCGPATTTCTDISFSIGLDPGGYVIWLERHHSTRNLTISCRVTVVYPG